MTAPKQATLKNANLPCGFRLEPAGSKACAIGRSHENVLGASDRNV